MLPSDNVVVCVESVFVFVFILALATWWAVVSVATVIVETRMGADAAGASVVGGILREILQSEFAMGALQDFKIVSELCIR